jgi:hypothetical protein
MIIIYVVGCPAVAFIILYKSRNHLKDPVIIRYIILLYQGLKHEVYYWELVNTFRKVLLLSFHVFIPDTLRVMKALFGVLIMFVISLIQARIKPFKIDIITTLGKRLFANFTIENREMMASMLTLYGGLIFAQEDQSLLVLRVMFFFLIIYMNLRYLILWVFCMSSIYRKYKYIASFSSYIKKIFCIT